MNEHTENFIEAWGSVGVLWGINRSMARVHALLLVSEQPQDLDAIADTLRISRGNASMCLRELRNWGVIQRVHEAGDRKDYYVAEPDALKMFFRIGTERKKREFDPALTALRHLLAEGDTEKTEGAHRRLTSLEAMMTTLDGIMTRVLTSEKTTRLALRLLRDLGKK
jgi:DNA-binding transcriptional regulator GbsR (MarR family)